MTVGVFILAAWFIAKEAIEPHWLLRLRSIVEPGPAPAELPFGDGLALRLYSDTRPLVGKIASLQKGLVLVQDGRELIQEGYGFGAPIVVYDGRAYLAREAEVEAVTRTTLSKRFVIGIEDTWTQLFRRKYRSVEPLGEVLFTYSVSAPGILDVEVDFSGLTRVPDLVYLPNEQGAGYFTLYSDSAGVARYFADVPDTPDRWIPTKEARTCFAAPARGLRFCVETEPGQAKFVGRERYWQWRWSGIFVLSWAGTDLELSKPQGTYRYRVVVEPIPRPNGTEEP